MPNSAITSDNHCAQRLPFNADAALISVQSARVTRCKTQYGWLHFRCLPLDSQDDARASSFAPSPSLTSETIASQPRTRQARPKKPEIVCPTSFVLTSHYCSTAPRMGKIYSSSLGCLGHVGCLNPRSSNQNKLEVKKDIIARHFFKPTSRVTCLQSHVCFLKQATRAMTRLARRLHFAERTAVTLVESSEQEVEWQRWFNHNADPESPLPHVCQSHLPKSPLPFFASAKVEARAEFAAGVCNPIMHTLSATKM